jgi:hypothetical protein
MLQLNFINAWLCRFLPSEASLRDAVWLIVKSTKTSPSPPFVGRGRGEVFTYENERRRFVYATLRKT